MITRGAVDSSSEYKGATKWLYLPKELALAVTGGEKRKLKAKMLYFSVGTYIFLVVFCLLDTEIFNPLPIEPNEHINDFLRGFSLGIAMAALGLNILYLCGFLDKAREYKLKIFRKNK